MNLSIEKIASVLGCTKPNIKYQIRYVSIDSRQILEARQTLFFALKGSQVDGHQYIAAAYKIGIRNFVVKSLPTVTIYKQANFLVVRNTLHALQQLAKYFRRSLSTKVIGVTGSNGKTVVKEWLASILSIKYKTFKSPKSYNSQIGVPLSIFQITEEDEYAILEAGISTTGEMVKLQKMIVPNIGILTNIGSAHDEGFENKNSKIEEKLKLFSNVDTMIFCADQKWISSSNFTKKTDQYTWSKKSKGPLQKVFITKEQNKSTIQFSCHKKPYKFDVKFIDNASLENVMHCITVALVLNLTEAEIQKGLDGLYAVEMRLQMLAGENQCILINDAYTADIESLTAGLDFQDRQHTGKSKTVILSDFLQSGKGERKLYAQIARLCLQYSVRKVFGIGNEIGILDSFLDASIERYFYQDTAAYLRHQKEVPPVNEIILVKGARRFQFEKIIEILSEKRHEASLQVDLSALMHNVQFFQSRLNKKTKLLAVIKASGYGSGAIQIASILEKSKVDYFGVAYVNEGIALRQKGIRKPILVLNCQAATFPALLGYDLEPEIYSMEQLSQLISFMQDHQKINIHLKIDTGMNRLGFQEEELDQLAYLLIKAKKQIRVKSILTHLAASDVPAEDSFSKTQLLHFDKAYIYLVDRLKYRCDRHALNTAGILRFPEYQYEMVRLGLGLYGIDPSGETNDVLQEVLSFKASITQIKQLSAGDTVGYNRKGKVKSNKKIAIINVGYADGLLRKAGNGRFKVLINGQLAPTIGNICMDMSMIDISKIADAKVNDEVLLFGKGHSVGHLCKALDTIPYEVFTGISERIKRVYYQE